MEEKPEQWHWQEEGISWKGIGIYHFTITIPSRKPLLGTLVIPDGNPANAWLEPSELGRALLDCQRSLSLFYPEIQILQYCIMPDHLHCILYVRRPMVHSIRYVAQGFWRAAKKMGRAYSYLDLLNKQDVRLPGGSIDKRNNTLDKSQPSYDFRWQEGKQLSLLSIAPADSRENPLVKVLGKDVYSELDPLFTEVPFIRPLSRRGQLQTMFRYLRLNPQRLATKRVKPGFFMVQDNISISGRLYTGVGNICLLYGTCYATVHVRRTMVEAAAHGQSQSLRDYMNSCVLAARQGAVMVSPFISPEENKVKEVLLSEHHPIIVLANNGFCDYYKPPADLFDSVAEGNVLILSPWPYDAGKRHISRADCVLLNEMAEEIATLR